MAVWQAYIITRALTATDTRQGRDVSVVTLFFTVVCLRAQTGGSFSLSQKGSIVWLMLKSNKE